MAAGRPRAFDRELVLKKAMFLFWEKGYEGTTMADMVDTIGIKAPSIYATFGNKDALFREAVTLYTEAIIKGPRLALQSEPNIYKAVQSSLKKYVDISTNPSYPPSCLIMYGAVNTAPENMYHVDALKQLRASIKNAWIVRFTKAKEDGQLKHDADPIAIAEFFVTFLHGMALRSKDGSRKKELLSSCQFALIGLTAFLQENAKP